VLDTQHHRNIDSIDVQCAATFTDHVICQAAFVFTGKGQITVAGEITGLENNPPFTLPITGGSGHYRDAKGEFRSVPINPNDSRVTFALDNDND
jgi:hypothetical protein